MLISFPFESDSLQLAGMVGFHFYFTPYTALTIEGFGASHRFARWQDDDFESDSQSIYEVGWRAGLTVRDDF